MTQLLTPSSDHRLADLVDELTKRLAAGNSADVEALLAEHPDQAEQLRPLIPTLQMLAEIGSSPAALGRSRDGLPDPSGHESNGHPVLGDFRILREVGRGGMGVVYEAEQISLRRRVALKVLPSAAMLDPRALQRFRNEAQAAAALHHSQIVPIYGVGCERGVHYYAMQFIDGMTLAEVIASLRQSAGLPLSPWERDGVREPDEPAAPHKPDAPARDLPPTTDSPARPPESEARLTPAPRPAAAEPAWPPGLTQAPRPAAETDVLAGLSTEKSRTSPAWFRRIAEQFAQVAEALHHAHEQGVTHRDIKPANLMLDRLGHIWITDFGLARIEGEGNLTMTGDLLGTLRYMSPEQSLGKRIGIDHRTDIYSLGITLYELLTLHPAFPGQGRQELLRQIAFDEPQPPRKHARTIPKDLETIILKMIEKNPADRYQSAQELAADLKRFADDRHIQARRPSLYSRSLKWSRRHVTALLVTLCIVTLFAFSTSVSSFLILQARNEAVAKSTDLQRERDNANKMLREMDSSIQDMFDGVSHLPTTDPGRKVLAEQQVKLFENLKSSDDKSPVVRELSARAHHRLAYMQIDSGENEASAENFRTTIALLNALAADDRNNADIESQLAEATANYGRLRILVGNNPDAEKQFKSAIDHAERALRLDPQNLGATTRLAWAHGLLGWLYGRLGPRAEAIRLHRREIELHESVVAKPRQDQQPQALIGDGRGPANWNNRLYLAAAHASLADTYAYGEDLKNAIEEVTIAIDIQTTLDQERPTDYLGRSRVMEYYLRRAGYCLRVQATHCDPLRDLELALQTKLVNPSMLNLAASIVSDNCEALRDLDESRKDEHVLESVVSNLTKLLESHPDPVVELGMQTHLAVMLARLGRHAEAKRIWQLTFQAPVTADFWSSRGPQGLAEANTLAWKLVTCPYPDGRNPDLGVRLSLLTVQKEPHTDRYWNTLGVAYYRSGDLRSSIEALNRSEKLRAAGLVYNWFFLAMAHWQLGEWQVALEYYRRATSWVDDFNYHNQEEQLRRFEQEAAELLGEPN